MPSYILSHILSLNPSHILSDTSSYIHSLTFSPTCPLSCFLTSFHTCSLPQLTGDATAAAAASDANYFYWKQTSVDYHTQFINTGDTTVTRYLEVDQRSYLVGAFETLLNLAVFMESAWAGQYREAFNVLDRLSLLPQNSDEVSLAAQQFPTLDKCIRRVADQILVWIYTPLLSFSWPLP